MKDIAEARMIAKRGIDWMTENPGMHPENLKAGLLEILNEIDSKIESGILSFFNQSRIQQIHAVGENHSVLIQMQRSQ
jgi:hypothetical protein